MKMHAAQTLARYSTYRLNDLLHLRRGCVSSRIGKRNGIGACCDTADNDIAYVVHGHFPLQRTTEHGRQARYQRRTATVGIDQFTDTSELLHHFHGLAADIGQAVLCADRHWGHDAMYA